MTGIRLADRMARLGTESAFEVLARARAIEDAGGKIIHLEIGEPDFPTAPHIIQAAVEALRAGATHYVPAPGIPPLRQAVAADLKPGLLPLVPAEQDPASGRVHDQRGRGDVQREVSPVGVAGRRQECPHPLDIGRLSVGCRVVTVQKRGQLSHRTSMAGAR